VFHPGSMRDGYSAVKNTDSWPEIGRGKVVAVMSDQPKCWPTAEDTVARARVGGVFYSNTFRSGEPWVFVWHCGGPTGHLA